MSQTRSASENAGAQEPRRPARSLTRGVGRALFACAFALVLALGAGFVWFISQVPVTERTLHRSADGIVVLTGGASRISDAVELLAAGRGKRLLISGVHPTSSRKEIAGHTPEYRQIFQCCVDLDRSALNTLGNATQARQWARSHDFNSLIVVTSAYHMPRAMAELKHQLPDVTLIPFPVVTEKLRDGEWWNDPTIARLLVSEYLKYIVAKVRMELGPKADALVASRFSEMHSQSAPARVVR